MKHIAIVVRAEWDNEAKVWTATSNDIDGLVVEADTLEALETKIKNAITDLLEINGIDDEVYKGISEVPIHIIAEQKSTILLNCA